MATSVHNILIVSYTSHSVYTGSLSKDEMPAVQYYRELRIHGILYKKEVFVDMIVLKKTDYKRAA